ncbi:hypothetical protein B0H17DRAFT_576058, partial [Mycena rosella]
LPQPPCSIDAPASDVLFRSACGPAPGTERIHQDLGSSRTIRARFEQDCSRPCHWPLCPKSGKSDIRKQAEQCDTFCGCDLYTSATPARQRYITGICYPHLQATFQHGTHLGDDHSYALSVIHPGLSYSESYSIHRVCGFILSPKLTHGRPHSPRHLRHYLRASRNMLHRMALLPTAGQPSLRAGGSRDEIKGDGDPLLIRAAYLYHLRDLGH